jgi:hypothetical protein
MTLASILRYEPPDVPRVRAPSLRAIVVWSLAAALFYGAVMGTSGNVIAGRPLQILYSAIKLPLLLATAFAIGIPSFFILNTLLGVREDFGQVLRALATSGAAFTISLASLAPLTLLWYISTRNHELHILFNAAMFALASVGSQSLLRQHYARLILRSRTHAWLLKLWLFIYAFVGIQAGWVLRPFIGDPGRATQFLRDDPWTNAYVWLARTMWKVIT